MKSRIRLGGAARDFDSRQSREEAINCYLEMDNRGEFKRLTGTPGFRNFIELGNGPIRGMHVAADNLYVVSGSEFYRVSVNPVGSVQAEVKGTVAGLSGPVRIDSIGTDEPQIMALTNTRGFIYKPSDDSFAEVTDLDFDPDFSITSFNQRFWFNKPNSNEFFGSEILDGFSYDPLFFASAENNPDQLEYVIALNTSLYLFGSSTIEHWQDTQRGEFSLRRVTGGTIDRGLGARASITKWENSIFFLADDFTVRTLGSGGYKKISDLSFEEEIDTYSFPDRAEGFFVDNPHYKCYCLYFPAEGVTWCYDVEKDLWHKRESVEGGGWKITTSSLIFDNVIIGSKFDGKLYVLDEREYTEAGDKMIMRWITPGVRSAEGPITVPYLEIYPEVGVGMISNEDEAGLQTLPVEPKISLKVSRDGGNNWTNYPDRGLGRIGDFDKKVRWRNLGRIKQGQNLTLEFLISDNVKRQIYSGYIEAYQGV